MKTLNKKIASLFLLTFVLSMNFSIAQNTSKAIKFSESEGALTTNVFNPTPTNYSEIANLIVYPRELRATQTEGKVIFEVMVDENGNATSYEVVFSRNELLSEACIEHVKALKFKPAIKNGAPIAKKVYIPFKFKLTGK